MKSVPSTFDIILDRSIRGTNYQHCVDWAVDQLIDGIETDYVCRLAGQLPPYDHDLIGVLRDQALVELGFDVGDEERLFCQSIARAIGRDRFSDECLNELLEWARLIYLKHYSSKLHSLYLLFHARRGLDTYGEQHYLENFSDSNRDELTQKVLDEFITKYGE
ncbi:MAG: hypothetical protein WD030_08875 [Pirellulales bacterium]